MLALAAMGKINYKKFIFCNVGADSENPASIDYLNNYARPFAEKHGLTLIELQKTLRDGTPDTIYQRLTRPNSRSIGIPVRMSNGAPGNRTCTADFKIKVVDKWLRANGGKTRGAQVGLGISLDEFQRVKANVDPATIAWKFNDFPLIDLRMDRQACMNVIQEVGLPVPPKSSCTFCPFHSLANWHKLRQEQPAEFEKAADLEDFLNKRRADIGKDQVWFTTRLKPLRQAISSANQPSLFSDDDFCDSGYCHI